MAEAPRRVLLISATSAIAEAVARRMAARGDHLLLAARDGVRLRRVADDLRVRGAGATQCHELDVARLDDHERFIEAAWPAGERIDVVLIAHGTLPEQKACEASAAQTVAELHVNFIATVSLLTLVAQRMHAQQGGTIAVITSVAGERGRQSNYVYGAAKGGVSLFLQGLRHRLASCGVRVVDIRPGFVDTPMTAAFDKGALWATPARVARDIERALDRGTPVVYTPHFWRWIMFVVRSVPTFLFHRTRL